VRRDLNLTELSVEAARHWIDNMYSTLGQLGKVLSVDRANKLVLLRFQVSPQGLREEYWYHTSLLAALPATTSAAGALVNVAPSLDTAMGQLSGLADESGGKPRKRLTMENVTERLTQLYGEGIALFAHHVLAILRAHASVPSRADLEGETKKPSEKEKDLEVAPEREKKRVKIDDFFKKRKKSDLLDAAEDDRALACLSAEGRIHPTEAFLRQCYLPSTLHSFV
jgi:hypothetical protein